MNTMNEKMVAIFENDFLTIKKKNERRKLKPKIKEKTKNEKQERTGTMAHICFEIHRMK